MVRKIIAGLIGISLLLALSGFVSAYGGVYNYYDGWGYYPGNYDRYSYHSERENGWGYAKIVDYNRIQSSRYVGYGGWETTVSYTKTVREYPGYGYGYGGSWYNSYPRYYRW